MLAVDPVLKFWFGALESASSFPDDKSGRWFIKDEKFDALIAEDFLDYVEAEDRGELAYWAQSPHGALALILVLDQFRRNIYRGKPEAFSGDERAIAICLDGIEAGHDQALFPIERAFFYMPLMHSEDIELSDKGIELFAALAESAPAPITDFLKSNHDYMIRHRDIIARFGRYPHRNNILGRSSTEEELEFLKEPGSSF